MKNLKDFKTKEELKKFRSQILLAKTSPKAEFKTGKNFEIKEEYYNLDGIKQTISFINNEFNHNPFYFRDKSLMTEENAKNYFKNGHCFYYAKMLKQLFPQNSKIRCGDDHFVIEIDNILYDVTRECGSFSDPLLKQDYPQVIENENNIVNKIYPRNETISLNVVKSETGPTSYLLPASKYEREQDEIKIAKLIEKVRTECEPYKEMMNKSKKL